MTRREGGSGAAGGGAGEDSLRLLEAFDGELARLRESATFTNRELASLSHGMSGGLRRAFDGLVFDGGKLETALKGLSRQILETVHSVAMRPVHNALGGAIAGGIGSLMSGLMPGNATGSFTENQLMRFAPGGLVSGAARRLSEAPAQARAEALSAGTGSGKGLAAPQSAARPVSVVMNITSPDAEGFRRSESQIAAQIGRALARGQRNR